MLLGILIGLGLGYFFHEPIGKGLGKALAKIKAWRENRKSQQHSEEY
jgi:hypothetical protein